MTMDSKSFRKSILFAGAFLVLLLPLALYLQSANRQPFPEEALDVVTAYLKATYARDQREAYFHISSLDQRIRDERSYVQAQGAFDGFTLQLARKLAGFMELWPVEHKTTSDRAQFKVGYRVP